MSMTTHDWSNQDAPEMMKEAGLSLKATESTDRGRIHEFERLGCPDQRGVVLDDERYGITVGIRLELPEGAPMRNASPMSMEALAFLGALSRSLQARGLQAQLITGQQGLEAVLVSRHICGGGDRPNFRQHVAEISEVIEGISPSLHARGQELVERILDRTVPLHAGVLRDLRPTSPLVVPTFDEAQRDRMMEKS